MVSDKDERDLLHLFDEKLLKPAVRIQTKLTRRFLTVSDLKKRLGLTKRQLSYWETKGIRREIGTTNKRKWRRFSIADMLSLAIVKTLNMQGVPLDACTSVFRWLQENLQYNAHMILYMTEGDDIFLFVDILSNTFDVYARSEFMPYNFDDVLHTLLAPQIVVPLLPLLLMVLVKNPMPDFGYRIKDNKVTFLVDGQEVRFDLTAEEKKLLCDPSVLKSMHRKSKNNNVGENK